eukprot:Gregarina_sp_Poly_1__5420@NODE_2864_length_1616_cov_125_982569_g967_i2_p1_GENE_NODE_2864_length_1616_cov_125_982569_g967_i2NODE_2864_length_1616_cov_125_982569_g967_i2_p1_ORF_typecomplete_len348_score29_90His_Phos_1/PF00300_22/1_5e05HBM/PF16591_5/0_05DUF2835/PF11197_8/0_16_NODE_2864_length_1616_cov_125_982569_g967_i2391082
MAHWVISRIISALALLLCIGLIANVFVKYWQRVTRESSGMMASPAWMFLEMQLRSLAGKVEHVEKKTEGKSEWILHGYRALHSLTLQALSCERFIEKSQLLQLEVGSKRRLLFQHMGFISLAVLESLVCFALKFGLLLYAITRYIVSAEMQGFSEAVETYWEPLVDKSHQLTNGSKSERRIRIIFIRHGESMWNRAFNQGFNWRTVLRIITVSFWELSLVGDLDSAIFDSPLSSLGVAQAAELQNWFASEEQATSNQQSTSMKEHKARFSNFIERLHQRSATGTKVAFLASNLRRAISTLGVAASQLMTPEDQVLVTSHLQVLRIKSVQLAKDFDFRSPLGTRTVCL